MIKKAGSFWNWAEAFALVSSFMIMTAGWVVMYPVAIASGDLLERIAAQPSAWDQGHRLLLLGAFLQPISVLVLFKQTRAAALRLSQTALIMAIAGSFALAGQYAFDFAALVQANSQITAPDNLTIIELARQHPWVSFFFYDLGDILFLGHILFAIAMFKAKGLLQAASLFVFGGLLVVAFGYDIHPVSIRIGFILISLGYLVVTPQVIKNPTANK